MLFHVQPVMLGCLKVNIFVVTPAKGQIHHFLSVFLFAAVFARNKSQME